MHPVIWKEHDNSWTWSIEEGKAFEDDHQVLARDEGFRTRGDAREAMQTAWNRLLAEGKTPGRPGSKKPTVSASDQSVAKSPDNKPTASGAAGVQLDWAVVTGDTIIAVFATQSQARKFGRENHKGKYKLRKVICDISE